MTEPVREDFTIKEGRDVTLVIAVEADEGQTLEGADIQFQMARHSGSHILVVQKSLGDGIVTTTEDLTFEVDLTAADTQGLEGVYYYEVLITTAENKKITPTYGYITVEDTLIGEASE